MDAVLSIAERHRLKVVEDCAIAIGARYRGKHVGLIGDMGCFSFYPVKHITTGEGGMFITRHRSVAEHVAHIRAFGVDRTHQERAIPGMYDVTAAGLNYRMGEMQAALGRQQLKRIDEILARRRANFQRLKESLLDVKDILIIDSSDTQALNSHYCLSLVLQGKLQPARDEIVARLNQAGVGTSIYYPHPVPMLSYYRNKYGYQAHEFPNASAISNFSIALPVGPHIGLEDMDYIAIQFKNIIQEYYS
jgi:dTDP-4-amino-4,6-dideoxygalactose transaminase